jgi:hypothetical protein
MLKFVSLSRESGEEWLLQTLLVTGACLMFIPLAALADSDTWTKSVLAKGMKNQLPIDFTYFGLDSPMKLYQTAELKKVSKTLRVRPAARCAGGDCGGGSSEGTLLEMKGSRWRVRMKADEGDEGGEGWIPRSSIRVEDSVVVIKPDGNYDRDIFPPNVMAGGYFPKTRITEKNGKFFFVLRYIESYQEDDERFFGFEYDPEAGTIVNLVPWKKEEFPPQVPLKNVIGAAALTKLPKEIGLGKLGFRTMDYRKLEPDYRPTMSEDCPAVLAKGRVYLNCNLNQ